MKIAFIIGITGQDGAYLAQFLLKKNYKVIGITRDILYMNSKNLNFLNVKNEIEFHEVNNLDEVKINKLLLIFKPDEIYNLGAQSSVGTSFQKPFETLNYNILSVLCWVEGIKKHSPNSKFYHASSSEMFGNIQNSDLPISESKIFNPASPYGISKATAHWIVKNYRETYHIFATCGILFNHESCLRGPNYVVKKLINSSVNIKLGLKKDKIAVGNISITRDWGYAPLYVQAMWLMVQQDIADDYIICSGNHLSLKELITELFLQLNLDFEEHISIDPLFFRPLELNAIYGDNQKAKTNLSWNYNLSNKQLIETLIQDEIKFIEWEKTQEK